MAYLLYKYERRTAIRNISLVFPDIEPMIAKAIAKGSFASLGRNAYDALRLTFVSAEEVLGICSVDGEEHLSRAYKRGKGVIALTGHIGCWELLAAYFSRKSYKVSVIARDLRDARLNDILVDMRRRNGVVTITRGSSSIAGYRVIRRGEILGMLIDQDIDADGVFVPFFGVPAYTPRGAAVFALRSGAAVVPMGIHMQPDGFHNITVLPELEFPPERLTGNERIDELTLRCSMAVEKLIRIYVQQWVWFHNRWRRRPGGANGPKVYTAAGGRRVRPC